MFLGFVGGREAGTGELGSTKTNCALLLLLSSLLGGLLPPAWCLLCRGALLCAACLP